MEIRPATADDVPLVLPMVDKIGRMHEQLDPAKYSFRDAPARMYAGWLEARVKDPHSVFLVAAKNETLLNEVPFVVGFLIGTVEREIPIYRVSEYGFIHDLWIEPEYRHEGLGRQMIMLAIERFTAMGVPQVRLDTSHGNQAARSLFARCGFRPSTTEMLMELPPAPSA